MRGQAPCVSSDAMAGMQTPDLDPHTRAVPSRRRGRPRRLNTMGVGFAAANRSLHTSPKVRNDVVFALGAREIARTGRGPSFPETPQDTLSQKPTGIHGRNNGNHGFAWEPWFSRNHGGHFEGDPSPVFVMWAPQIMYSTTLVTPFWPSRHCFAFERNTASANTEHVTKGEQSAVERLGEDERRTNVAEKQS
eukprot:gene23861-biopygen17864